MQLSPLPWQSLTAHHPFSDAFQPARFFDFQPLAQHALTQFIQADTGALLLLKTEVLPAFLAEIQAFLTERHASSRLATDFSRTELCGSRVYLDKTGSVETIPGEIAHADGGILIVHLAALRRDLSQWDKLKHALLFGHYQPYAQNALPQAAEPLTAHFKLLLVGSRDDIATLNEYDDSLFHIAHYAEIESYLSSRDQLPLWANYVQTLAQTELGSRLPPKALNQIYQHFVRQSESRESVPLSPTQLSQHLRGIAHFYPKATAYRDVQGYFDQLTQQAAVLHRYALQEILTEQTQIATEGEEIGQINGLSVVEFNGVPYAFGEPLRISCNVQYGDGEIHDIERKVELGGNLHAKGILLAQSCLSHLLELPTQLPFSATLAFEQSYGEIDGDSSSLAIFCALISALAKCPIPQSIAVTGAIDQRGNVLSVGGVNQKIEGFFSLCAARGLTGKEGVIIPQACLSHLSLTSAVVEAVKAGQFQIWAVEQATDALQLLLNHAFYDEDQAESTEKPTLFDLIHQHLDEQNEEPSGSFWQKITKWF